MATPLGIEILLHYYSSEGATSDSNKIREDRVSVKEELRDLIQEKMLSNNPVNIANNITPCYSITNKGRFYVEYLLNVPLPVECTTYVIERPIEALRKVLS